MTKCLRFAVFVVLCSLAAAAPAPAQIVESAGSRALGMGGAFVAVANDSSATWWNPAGLAAGPFIDLALTRTVVSVGETLPAGRERLSSFALGTPPLGLSYYRLRLTQIRPFDPTAGDSAGREDRRAEVPVRALSASQFGATFVQTLISGVHVGTTVKYVRGTFRETVADGAADPSDLLDLGEDLEGGEGEGRFDLDVGALAVGGPVRLGVVVRNVREPEFGELQLERQVRFGAAFDGEAAGLPPFTVGLDADLSRYTTPTGDRRAVAVGWEQWFRSRRLGIRAGGRLNAVGGRERAATGGISVAPRSGLYVDAHLVRGGAADDRGWGIAARVSF